ncbi:dephospho-CoA kinase [Ekhidna sp. To15]|uniref:dephospho-CoA kinase n=1 Tax=Ekhidna sp. To15 TaxID=3395267 RepID=UPI003F51F379
MNKEPLIVGVTGGIGSGKSTVCKVFETLGAITYYADDRAKWLMNNDDELKEKIKGLFGEQAYREGTLDRKHIASIAFKDQSILERLNQLVHPAVAKDVSQWVEENQQAPLLLKEAALLYETGSYKSLSKTILVTAPEVIRIRRVIQRDSHRSAEDVKAIIDKQMGDDEKITLADFVIDNDEKRSVIKQVMDIHPLLVA